MKGSLHRGLKLANTLNRNLNLLTRSLPTRLDGIADSQSLHLRGSADFPICCIARFQRARPFALQKGEGSHIAFASSAFVEFVSSFPQLRIKTEQN